MDEKLTPPSERVEKIIAEIRRRTAQKAYALTIVPERQPTIFDSKFGGLPYWDLQKPYPTDPEGEKMLLLAQICFDEAEVEAPLPQTGMLQFFIARDDVFGLDCDEPDKQDTFRVVYHEQVDHSVTADAVRALGIPEAVEDDEDYTPVWNEVAVSITKEISYMSADSYNFASLFHLLMKEVCGQDIADQPCYTVLTEEENSYLYESLQTTGHRMLGYPFFTQNDPRMYEEEIWEEIWREGYEPHSKYDTLLFQMDSEMGENGKDYVLWGDCGVGNFFIARKDLEKCDFSKVLYNWDCC